MCQVIDFCYIAGGRWARSTRDSYRILLEKREVTVIQFHCQTNDRLCKYITVFFRLGYCQQCRFMTPMYSSELCIVSEILVGGRRRVYWAGGKVGRCCTKHSFAGGLDRHPFTSGDRRSRCRRMWALRWLSYGWVHTHIHHALIPPV